MRGSLAAIVSPTLRVFRHAREIRQMQVMAEPGRFRLELLHRRFRPRFVPRDDDNSRAHARERDDCGFADAGGRARGDDGPALHQLYPLASE